MKKTLLLIINVCSFLNLKAQEISYGIIVGQNLYNSHSKGVIFFDSGNDQFSVWNLGGYVEYELKKDMGIKTEITFNTKTFEMGFDHAMTGLEYDFGFIDIAPSFKYDFGSEYRKGFYMMIGPRFSVKTKQKLTENTEDLDEFPEFKTVNVGIQLALGQRFLKILEIEGKFDYGVTPFFKLGDSSSKIYGFYISLHLDLEKIPNNRKKSDN